MDKSKVLVVMTALSSEVRLDAYRQLVPRGATGMVVKVTDMKTIVDYGVLSTPGLVIDEKLVSSGRIPTQAEVKQWLAT